MEIIKKIQNRRGAQLHIKGSAEKVFTKLPTPTRYALTPDDFFGTIPKLIKKEGEKIQAGAPLFHSKNNPQIQFVSPV